MPALNARGRLPAERPRAGCAPHRCPCCRPQDVQERWFAAQIELAEELQLPLFLHCRDAWQRFAEILRCGMQGRRLGCMGAC